MPRTGNAPRMFPLLGFVLLVASTVYADGSVYTLSKYRQLVTSSTLHWLSISHYDPTKEFVIGGFEERRDINGQIQNNNNQAEGPSISRSIYVCRVMHNGVPVPGRQIEGEKNCTITYLGNVVSYARFDLLENVENSARLSWVSWDHFHQTPLGAVSTEKNYVARYVVSDKENMDKSIAYTHYIGTYYPTEGLGIITYVKDDGTEGSTKSGEILVETEPTMYELVGVKLNHHRERILQREPRVLRQLTIKNERSEPAVLGEALPYSFNYTVYWGQGHAIIRALKTSITSINGISLGDILWGTENKTVRTNVSTIKISLGPGTAVNVSLTANYTQKEVPYSAELISIYEDGERRSRTIGGIFHEKGLQDIKAEFSPVYFLSNMSIVPTTLPPPTTETTTTTTTTTSTSKQPEYVSTKKNPPINEATPKLDDNLIIPLRNSETSNIQNDDGGPLSLKNKVEGAQSSAHSNKIPFQPIIIFLTIISIVTFHRIT